MDPVTVWMVIMACALAFFGVTVAADPPRPAREACYATAMPDGGVRCDPFDPHYPLGDR